MQAPPKKYDDIFLPRWQFAQSADTKIYSQIAQLGNLSSANVPQGHAECFFFFLLIGTAVCHHTQRNFRPELMVSELCVMFCVISFEALRRNFLQRCRHLPNVQCPNERGSYSEQREKKTTLMCQLSVAYVETATAAPIAALSCLEDRNWRL